MAAVSLGALTLLGDARATDAPGTVVSLEPDLAACGGTGFTGARLAPTAELFCTHTAPDLGPAMAAKARTGVQAPMQAAAAGATRPACYGSGTSGKRVQAIYAIPHGSGYNHANRMAIRDNWIANMEGAVREASRSTGKELGIRWVMDGTCSVDVAVAYLPTDSSRVDEFQFARITAALRSQGFNRTDRKYVVWFQGGGAACGIATVAHDDSPAATNLHNGNPLQTSSANPNYAHIYSPCWGLGATGADVELHELFHTLGAVQLSAPHSNGLAHCLDEADILCYVEGDPPRHTWVACAGPEQIDCHKDDYFNTNPSPMSYLATHWNTANSRFLGEFVATDVQPALPATPVRPPSP